MSRSDWVSKPAVVGVAAALILIVLLSTGYLLSYQRYHAGQRQAAAAEQQDQVEKVRRSCVFDPNSRVLTCDVHPEQGEGGEKYTAYDLEAQQDMAEWAFAMFAASLLGVMITGAATYYVAMTLRETQRMVKAAEDTIAVTREMARDQSRAYVHAKRAEVIWRNDGTGAVFVDIENVGQTPVKWYGYKCFAALGDTKLDAPFPSDEIRARPLARWSFLPNGTPISAKIIDPLVLDAMYRARKFECEFKLDGIVFYETFFGEEFETEFSFFADNVGQGLNLNTETGETKPSPDKLKMFPRRLRTYEKVDEHHQPKQ